MTICFSTGFSCFAEEGSAEKVVSEAVDKKTEKEDLENIIRERLKLERLNEKEEALIKTLTRRKNVWKAEKIPFFILIGCISTVRGLIAVIYKSPGLLIASLLPVIIAMINNIPYKMFSGLIEDLKNNKKRLDDYIEGKGDWRARL